MGCSAGCSTGLHLVQLFSDAPQGTAFAVHGPAGDQVFGDGAEADESVEFFGDGAVLAVEDLDIGQMQQIFGDGDGLGADVAGRQRVGGFVADRDLDVAIAAGESQVGVEALTASTPTGRRSRPLHRGNASFASRPLVIDPTCPGAIPVAWPKRQKAAGTN